MADRYATLRHGLVGAWCPSITSGGYTLPDLSPTRANGTLTNMGGQVAWSARPGGVALDFDGSNDYVAIPSTITVSTSNPFSVSAWVWTKDLTTQLYPHAVVLRSSSGSTPFEIALSNQSSYVGVLLGSQSTWGTYRADPSWVSGKWNHVVVTYNGGGNASSSYGVYVNGTAVSVVSAAGFAVLTNASALGGPTSGGSSNRLFGFLDDARVYSRVLLGAEVSLLASRRGIGLLPTRHRRANVLGSQFWLRQSGEWKKATGWIKVNGVWTKATPKINVSGTWK